MDVHVLQVVEQVLEVPKISSRGRILQGTAEQILDVPVPEMVRVPGQNPGADCGAHRWNVSSAGRGGTGGGLQVIDR